MNIRILAASALALAILVPAANAATEHGGRSNVNRERASFAGDNSSDTNGTCPGGYANLATDQCVPYGAPFKAQNDKARKLVRVVKAKPVQSSSFVRLTDRIQYILANGNDNN